MIEAVARVLFRLLLCAAVIYPVWRWLGIVSVVLCSPLFGIALARPLVNLMSEVRHGFRAAVHRRGPDETYVYRGIAIGVRRDEELVCFIRLQDARKVLPSLPGDETVERLLPHGVRRYGQAAYLRDDALIELLRNAQSTRTRRFRTWVQTQILQPAHRLRERSSVAADAARD